jgi:hypothetical protein
MDISDILELIPVIPILITFAILLAKVKTRIVYYVLIGLLSIGFMYSILFMPFSPFAASIIVFGNNRIAGFIMVVFISLTFLGAVYLTKVTTPRVIDFYQKNNYRKLVPVSIVSLIIILYIYYLPLGLRADFYSGGSGYESIPELFWPVYRYLYKSFLRFCGQTGYVAICIILSIFWLYCVVAFWAGYFCSGCKRVKESFASKNGKQQAS